MNLVGRTLGPYKLEAPLGRGGMAAVYRAYQASVRRYVAIKVMASDIANEPGFIERFEREAQIIAGLEHPHILPVIDFGNADGVYYIVMRYMDGGSLDDKMRQKRLTLLQTNHALSQIASALDYAHKKGIVHRDLKPNNVLLDKDDNCYLTDFGIARVEGSDRKLTATGSVMGTPSYMSPEQGMGHSVDSRSDIYTLGVILYEMVCGVLPFSADTPAALIFQHVYEAPRPPRQARPDLTDAVLLVLDRALAKNPDARYQTADEMAKGFAMAIGERPTSISLGMPTPSGQMPQPQFGGTMRPPAPGTPQSTGPTYYPPPPTTPYQTGPGNAPTITPSTAYQAGMVGQPTITPAPAARGSKASIALLAIAALVVIGIIVAVIILGNSGSNQATAASQTAVAQAQTEVAIRLSATKTPTATSAVTNTPTITPTPTLDTTGTAIAGVLATTTAQFGAQTQAALDQTATSQAVAFATGQFQTAVAVVNATLTAQAEIAATETARSASPTPRFDPIATLNAAKTLTAAAPTPRRSTATPTGEITKVAAAITPAAGGEADLVSDDGPTILAALKSLDLVSSTARVVRVPVQNIAPLLTGDSARSNYIILSPFSPARFYDVAFSFDVELSASDAAVGRTSCGFYVGSESEFYRGDELQELNAYIVQYYRTSQIRLDRREALQWQSPLFNDTNGAIRPDNATTNRFVVVVRGTQLTVFVNGVKIIGALDMPKYQGGGIGYFMIRGATGDAEQCAFSNINAWRIS